MKALPASAQLLTGQLNSLPAESSADLVLLAKLDILKVCKQMGTVQDLDPEQQLTLKAGLVHANPDVRAAAFAVICESKKRGSVPSGEERNLLLNFIYQSSTEDSPRFRQCVQGTVIIFLVYRNLRQHL